MLNFQSVFTRHARRKPYGASSCPRGRCTRVPDFDVEPNAALFDICGTCGRTLPWATTLAVAAAPPAVALVPTPQSRRSAARCVSVPVRLAVFTLLAALMRGRRRSGGGRVQ